MTKEQSQVIWQADLADLVKQARHVANDQMIEGHKLEANQLSLTMANTAERLGDLLSQYIETKWRLREVLQGLASAIQGDQAAATMRKHPAFDAALAELAGTNN